jgi:hypothetical protein
MQENDTRPFYQYHTSNDKFKNVNLSNSGYKSGQRTIHTYAPGVILPIDSQRPSPNLKALIWIQETDATIDNFGCHVSRFPKIVYYILL